ncbi:MAG: hypothetical protein BroJett040_01540 [Oligoflexia bacterium]|nr:MAG: hypothetical protein BroJett040_01540 [Oligoflexia bacterium]
MKPLMNLGLGVLISAASLIAQAQYRQESVELRFNGYEVRGDMTLHLRQELSRQQPYFDQQSFDIERVVLIAKSEFGRAEAQVEIAGVRSEVRMVDGRREWFYSPDPRTYFSIDFYNPGRISQGAWMVHLRGHVMVDRVILIGNRDPFRPNPGPAPYPGPGPGPRPGPGPGPRPPHEDPWGRIEYYEGGSERTQKLVETTKEFNTRRFDEPVLRIRITGTKERVRITRAMAELQDGRMFDLSELRTVVREGQEIGTFLDRAFVRKVIITATSDNLSGSRGEYRLDFGVRVR